MIQTPDPKQVRLAAGILREVAVYRSQTRHGDTDDTPNQNSEWTPYTAGQLESIADKIDLEHTRVAESLAATMYQAITRGDWASARHVERLGYIEAAESAIDDGWHK